MVTLFSILKLTHLSQDAKNNVVNDELRFQMIRLICSRYKMRGLIGVLDDQDIQKIRSLVKSVSVVKVNSIHDAHLMEPKILIDVVSKYLKSIAF